MSVNNDNFLLEESDLEQVRDICKYIEDDKIRERAVANCLSAEAVSKYFVDIEVDTKTGIHNVPQVLEDIEIADIYIKNNFIDVRIYFNENELCVPKTHYDLGIAPAAYMFVKIDESLSNCSVSGFLLSENVDTSNDYKGYYKVSVQDLVSFYDMESSLATNYEDEYPENFEKDVFDFLDKRLENKKDFYRVLLKSGTAREYLINASKAKNVFNFISSTDEVNSADSPVITNLETDDMPVAEILSENDSLSLELEQPSDLDLSESTFDLAETETEDDISLVEAEPIDMLEANDDDLTISAEDDLQEPVETDEIQINFSDEPISLESSNTDFIDQTETNDNATEDFGEINILDTSIEESEETEDNEIQLDLAQDSISIDTDYDVQEENTYVDTDNSAQDAGTYVDIGDDTQEESTDSVIDELSEFNYTTDIEPSLDTIENSDTDEDSSDLTEDLLDSFYEQPQKATDNESAAPVDTASIEGNAQYEEVPQTELQPAAQKKKSSPLLPVIAIIALLGAAGYYGYTKFQPSVPSPINNSQTQDISDEQDVEEDEDEPEEAANTEAMPVETVENVQKPKNTNEGKAVSIPAIEQNLDASILVSNLSVNWEVPQSYTTNSSAKRYFVRIGKVMQLNLKTELLLLSKPPITNRIAVELQYNKNSQKFEIKDIIASSGEKTVDDAIKTVVRNTLNMNLGSNMQVFDNLSGNPVLIIKL